MIRSRTAATAALAATLILSTASIARAAAPAADSVPVGPMPMPADFLPTPATASTTPLPCKVAPPNVQPPSLQRSDEAARRSLSTLGQWARRHFRFDGPTSCMDWAFAIRQWQATAGLPQTGVFTAVEVKSIQDETAKIADRQREAYAAWTAKRVDAHEAGIDPTSGRALTDEQKLRREQVLAAREGRPIPQALPPAAIVRPAPVGPPEKQAFGFSLGADLGPQAPVCALGVVRGLPMRSGPPCAFRMKSIGRSTLDYKTLLEREIFMETELSSDDVRPLATGIAGLMFSEQDRPGILARVGLRAWIVDGRLEGIGFLPSDKAAVLEAFRSRYGEPRTIPVPMQNSTGGQWVGNRYEFHAGDVTAVLNCVEFGGGCSFAEVLTDRGRQSLASEKAKATQRGEKF